MAKQEKAELTPQQYSLYYSLQTARSQAKKTKEKCLKEAYWAHAFSLASCYRKLYGSNVELAHEMVMGLQKTIEEMS